MSDTSHNIYVSAGGFDSPFYDFYTDASGTQELTPSNTLYLDTSYNFYRLDQATSHPFYISDVSYEQPHTSNITLTGDGSYNDGITGSETFTLEFTGLDTSDNLYYYCTAHSSMINEFTLVATTPVVDNIAPTLSSIIPLLDASNVDINSNLTFTFSENVVDGSGNITIYDNSDNIVNVINISDPIAISIVDNEVTVDPGTDLSYNTTYYVNIDSGTFEDGSGNAFTGLDSSSNTGMIFTTQLDTFAPTLISIFPTLNQTDIEINSNLTFTFSEDIVDASGNITIYDNSDNIVEVIDVSSTNVLLSGSQVTVDPLFDLSYSTSYYVNIDSGAFEDSIGNAFTGLDSSSNSGMRFITQEEPDLISPTLSSFIPSLNATDVSINTILEFTFDENIATNSGSIIIYDDSTSAVIQSIDVTSENISISGEILTVNPTTDLSYNNAYYVNIDSGAFQDVVGNQFVGLDSSLATGMRFTTETDVYPPILTSIVPVLNATDISINTNLDFIFNEDISAVSGNITIYDSSDNSIIQVIGVSSEYVSVSGNQAIITLQTDLSFDTSYYVNIDSGTFHDALSNTFTGVDSSSNSGMRFTTATDYIGPVITSISPLLNATDVSINSNLEFTFDEDISDGSGNITIYNDSTNTVVQTIDVSSTNIDISGNRVIVNPSVDLPYNTLLYVNIDEGTFQDGFTNNFAGLDSSSNTGMRFTTELDIIPPTLLSVSPALNATDISINSNLIFTFSEDVVDGSGNLYIYDSSTNALLNTFNVTSSNVSISGSQVTLNPTTDLSFNRSLYVNIDSGAFEDEGGNIYDGLDSSDSDAGMRFTTELDVTIPTITLYNPAQEETNIVINTDLEFTFSETIVIGSGNITVHRVSDDVIIETFDVSSSEVTIMDKKLVIAPSTDFPYNTTLYVNIDSGVVKDLRENDFVGLDSSLPETGLRFTTYRDTFAPSLVSYSPTLNATDISVNSSLEFTFSEDISANSGNITIYRSSNDIILQIIDVTSSNVTVSGRDVTVNLPRDLPSDLDVYVNIDSGAFKDNVDNLFVGLDSQTANSGMRFTMVSSDTDPDVTAPTLTSISPTLNSVDLRLDTALIFTFSEAVIPVSGSIVIYNASNNTILQSIDVSSSHIKIVGRQVTVNPPVYLPENTSIYVNFHGNAFLDYAGNNHNGLDSSVAGSGMRFTTVNLAQTRLSDIIRFCQDKKCQQNIQYNRLKTGGNDPSMSAAMRYAQYVRSTKPKANQST